MNRFSNAELRTMYRDCADKKHWLEEIGPYLANCDVEELKIKLGLVPKTKIKKVKKPESSDRTNKPWTNNELRYLKEHPNMSVEDLANALRRPIKSVRTYRSKLGLRYSHRWTQEELAYIVEQRRLGATNQQIAKHLKLKSSVIAQQVGRLKKEGRL